MIELTNENLASDFKIVVYCPFDRSTQNIFDQEVHFLNSTKFDRWDAFKMFPESWLCFLDADCTIDENLISAVHARIQNSSPATILCGRYKTADGAPTLSRAYNTLCNTWLEAGLLAAEPRMLGGLFVIFSSSHLQTIEFEKFPKWGAEDYRMARQLGKHDFNFELSENLMTQHCPKNDFSWFLKRAWIHGNNRPENVKTNLSHWVTMFARQNFISIAYITMHFGTLFASIACNRLKHKIDLLSSFFGSFSKDSTKIQSTRF